MDPRFYVFAFAGTFSFSGLFVYVANSPAIFMDYFHLSAKLYGGIFALLSLGFIGGSQVNHILTRYYKNETILQTTVIFQVAVAVLFFIGSVNEWYGLAPVIIFLFVLLSCAGLTYPNAASLAMAPFSKNAGTAAALLGFIQIGIGGLVSAVVGMLHFKATLTMSLIMALSAIVALIILLAGRSGINKQIS